MATEHVEITGNDHTSHNRLDAAAIATSVLFINLGENSDFTQTGEYGILAIPTLFMLQLKAIVGNALIATFCRFTRGRILAEAGFIITREEGPHGDVFQPSLFLTGRKKVRQTYKFLSYMAHFHILSDTVFASIGAHGDKIPQTPAHVVAGIP